MGAVAGWCLLLCWALTRAADAGEREAGRGVPGSTGATFPWTPEGDGGRRDFQSPPKPNRKKAQCWLCKEPTVL